MLHFPHDRRLKLSIQKVSQYHLHTACIAAETAIYLRLKQPHTPQSNDASTFDLTVEQHRLRTFNTNWNQALYDPKAPANEAFFSLSTTYNDIHCFSGGIILTTYPSNTFSFIIYLFASPNCKHLIQSDEANNTDGTYRFTQLHKIGNSKDLQENTPEAHMNHLIKVAGFSSMTNLHEIYYKCFSCYGIRNK